MDDVAHFRDVQSAGREVGGDENGRAPVRQARQALR